MGLMDMLRDRQFWGDVGDNAKQLGRAASDAAAANVTGPVDMASWLLRKAGVPVGDAPLGSSQWAKNAGMINGPQPNKLAQLMGETVGGVAPMVGVAKAPEIAKAFQGSADMMEILKRNGIPLK